ncbi:MAG: YqjK-like family protein [Methyloversatilis sp.]|jgi:hypothetical protein|nr:YqjK-like family protein [Methyloversatilis sp.]
MNARRLRLALTRERLIERSRQLRVEAATQSAVLGPVLHVGDQIRDSVVWVRSHPEVLAAALVGFAVVRPRRVWRWGLRLWGAWRLLGTLQHRLSSR